MPVIETEALTKRYGRGPDAVLAVDALDLRVEAGEVFGFLGPNGAGKSTTIDMLLDYVRPTAGSATILGRDAQGDAEALRGRIGVLPEGLGLYDRLTGRRHLEFAIDWADADDEPAAVRERVGLSAADGSRVVGEYSKGMCQRLALGMALVGDPELLVLDEPSSGLDPNGIRLMRELVREAAAAGTAVFLSSHVLGEVEAVCDRVGILDDGRLVAVDDVDRLRRAVGRGAELRLRVAGSLPVDVTALDGVESASRSGEVIRVRTTDPAEKADVIARLVDAGVDIRDVTADDPSLEDVFAAYTAGDADHGPTRETVATRGMSPTGVSP